jgi:flavin reductase (DIM6/NTAB) family NADH-FMN oxidoreductase RutF
MADGVREKLEAVFPSVIGVVVTKRGDKVNLCPINYQAISTVYETPLTITIGLSNRGYTLETVLETGEFVYAYPSTDQLDDVLHCGTVSGRTTDKLAATGLEFNQSLTIKPPHLKDAVLNYECRMVHHYNAGSFTIVVAEIQEIIPSSHKGDLDKIYSLGHHRYGALEGVKVLKEGRE